MGPFRCVRPADNTSERGKCTAATRLRTNVHRSSGRDDGFGGIAAHRIRRIYFMDGLLVVAIILATFVDIGCGADATPPPTTARPHAVTDTISRSQSLRTTRFTPISTTAVPPATFTRNATPKARANALAKGGGAMRETVVIPSSNSEREAQEIYDKALKQFDSYGASTRQVCGEWEQRGCQCSGTVDELILSCRAIALNETPSDLPKNLIKL